MLAINEYILKDINKKLKFYGEMFRNMPALGMCQDAFAKLEPARHALEKIIKDFNSASKNYILPTLETVEPILRNIEISLGDVNRQHKLGDLPLLPASKKETTQIDKMIKEIREMRAVIEKLVATKNSFTKAPEIFELTVNDREILINNFLISKPHAVGTNLATLQDIRIKKPNKPIRKSDLPNFLKEEIGSGSLADILYQLGFTGEILKAFFPKRSKKGVIQYAGDKITKKDLQNRGINISLLMKQLELANIKNNPE